MMRIEELGPPAIAQTRCTFGRAHDIGEQQGREDTVALRRMSNARDEFIDFVDETFGIAVPVSKIRTRQLDQFRARYPGGEVASCLERAADGVPSGQDQRGDSDRREYVAQIGLSVPLDLGDCRARRAGLTDPAHVPLELPIVFRHRGGGPFEAQAGEGSRPPPSTDVLQPFKLLEAWLPRHVVASQEARCRVIEHHG